MPAKCFGMFLWCAAASALDDFAFVAYWPHCLNSLHVEGESCQVNSCARIRHSLLPIWQNVCLSKHHRSLNRYHYCEAL
jgi:hypothetical protein